VVELKGERSLIPPRFAVGGALRFRERRWRSAWRIRQGSRRLIAPKTCRTQIGAVLHRYCLLPQTVPMKIANELLNLK